MNLTQGQLQEIIARGGLIAHKQVTFDGSSGNGSKPTAATATLTGTNAANGTTAKTVTIGAQTYTLKSALTDGSTHPGEVLIGISADATLTNLVNAINGAGTAGTDYDSSTPLNADVSAGAVGSHATILTSKVTTAAGNSVALSTTEATYSFNHATLTGGKTGTVALFTVTGQALVALFACCNTTLAGATATLKAGIASSAARYVPQITATTLTKGDTADLTGKVTAGTAIAKTPNQVAFDGEAIIGSVATADITAGSLDYYAVYFPLSDGASIF